MDEDAYHFLVGTYGWPHDVWVDWCVTTLLDQVFGLATPPEGILSGPQPTNH